MLSSCPFSIRFHSGCHSRFAGMDCLNHWIPACAGMTEEAEGQELGRGSKRAVGIATIPFPPQSSFRRRPESTPTGMQVVEPRREQAAEVVPIPLLWRGARQGGVVKRRREQAAEEGDDGVPRETPIQSELP